LERPARSLWTQKFYTKTHVEIFNFLKKILLFISSVKLKFLFSKPTAGSGEGYGCIRNTAKSAYFLGATEAIDVEYSLGGVRRNYSFIKSLIPYGRHFHIAYITIIPKKDVSRQILIKI
jgi:hypothetical protein